MKILIIMAGYLPGKKYGGPPISVNNFCSLMKEHESFIVTRNHDMGEKKAYLHIHKGWNDSDNCKVLYLTNKEYCYRSFKRVITELSPDIIYLQSLFQNYTVPCLILAKKYNIKVLLAPRGELCSGAFKKKYKKIPYIVCMKIAGLIKKIQFQSTSDEETRAIAACLSVSRERIHYLPNISSLPDCKYDPIVKKRGNAKFIFISRIVPKKNLYDAIRYLSQLLGEVQFDIYGPIEDKVYWDKCNSLISALPSNISANYCGQLSHEMVHKTFSQYHAFLFPTRSENFGHVIAEALSVGCPVILSDQTPWNDVEQYQAGWALPLKEDSRFVDVLQSLVDMDQETYSHIKTHVKDYFSNKSQLETVKKMYKKALDIN